MTEFFTKQRQKGQCENVDQVVCSTRSHASHSSVSSQKTLVLHSLGPASVRFAQDAYVVPIADITSYSCSSNNSSIAKQNATDQSQYHIMY